MGRLIHTKPNLLVFNKLDQIWFWKKKHSDYFFIGVYQYDGVFLVNRGSELGTICVFTIVVFLHIDDFQHV